MSINKFICTGNLTRDCELRTTPSGQYVANFGIAVTDRKKNANGEWVDVPNFAEMTMWGKRAEALSPYLVKGTKVAIESRMHYSSWEDRNSGQKRSRIDFNVEEIEFLSSRNGAPSGKQSMDTDYVMSYAKEVPQGAYSDEDIPF